MYTHLFKSGKIGSVALKNRIVMAPMVTGFASAIGEVTPQLIGYYTERAKGGAGLIIVEGTYIAEERGVGRIAIHDDQMMPGLNELTDAIHEWGTAVFDQFMHQGMYLWKDKDINQLTRKEVVSLIDRFRMAASRAKKAGFDGVELHGGHGYLIQQFLSPLTNKRTDEYGGSLVKRVTFAKEVIQAVKGEVGEDFPVTMRISMEERIPGGITIEETLEVVRHLENAGADAIHASVGSTKGSVQWVIAPMSVPKGFLIPLAERIKERLTIPVIAVGRINDPSLANDIIEKGKADFVAMGRALITDPALPQKVLNREFDSIRKCIACNYCFGKRFLEYRRLKCAINPNVGGEFKENKHAVSSRKRILIVGGGPGGMEAARILANRGHRVYLWEQEDELGGNFRYASLAPYKKEFENIVEYLRAQMRKLRVEVKLGVKVNEQMIKRGNFDVILLATGAKPIVPETRGINSNNVVFAADILSGKSRAGEEVVVIGGGKIGCETAEFLAEKKKKISIIEIREAVARDIEPITRMLLLDRLKEHRVNIYLNTSVSKIEGRTITIIGPKEIKKKIYAHTIVLSVGYTPNLSLYERLSNKYSKIFLIGDCKKPGEIADAIQEAARVANMI